MARLALCFFALLALWAAAGHAEQLCDEMEGMSICGALSPHDCDDAWSFFLSSYQDDTELVMWYGTFPSTAEDAQTCAEQDGCSLCFDFTDVDYDGTSVAATISAEDSCEGQVTEVGRASDTGLACCDPNYHHVPLEFGVAEMCMFDFMDMDSDDNCYYYYLEDDQGYYYCLDDYDYYDAARHTLGSQASRMANQLASHARDPPDFGVDYADGCFFMTGLPMVCIVPTVNVCSETPTIEVVTFLGIVMDYGTLETTQELCAELSAGTSLCISIENVDLSGEVLTYTTYLSMLGLDLSGPVYVTYTYPACGCGATEPADSPSSEDQSSAANKSSVGVESTGVSAVDDNDEGDGDDGAVDEGGDEDSGIATWSWMWSIIVGAVLLMGCVTIGILAALVIGGVIIFKKGTTPTADDPADDYDLEYA
mmetsp:Transcript_1962/g.7080  ORF Transcript_1962/g.7080 Transcript_1962/m.7080 type:complete len:423 (-) Transcript_1962:69-1337(-)